MSAFALLRMASQFFFVGWLLFFLLGGRLFLNVPSEILTFGDMEISLSFIKQLSICAGQTLCRARVLRDDFMDSLIYYPFQDDGILLNTDVHFSLMRKVVKGNLFWLDWAALGSFVLWFCLCALSSDHISHGNNAGFGKSGWICIAIVVPDPELRIVTLLYSYLKPPWLWGWQCWLAGQSATLVQTALNNCGMDCHESLHRRIGYRFTIWTLWLGFKLSAQTPKVFNVLC